MDATDHSERGAGRVALVTGGGSGIGAEIGRWLARHGVAVVLADVDESAARDVAAGIEDDGGDARGTFVDVTDESSVAGMVAAVEADYGRLDYLFANAGISGPVELADTSYEDWQQVIDVNLNGVYLTVSESAPLLVAGDDTAHVVVTASGDEPDPADGDVLRGHLRDVVATERDGTVTHVRRARARDTTVEEIMKEEEQSPPLRRTPEYEDVMGVLDYLLFQDGFVTGHEFHLDGGDHQAL
ncbi:hypothetical protein BRC83_01865 [Halobacteriales archaeon QS_1_68_17]|nr:MAG: hypothetical protein BRC83_01865 [Halobacteriales archaeon QS_1_68_17]